MKARLLPGEQVLYQAKLHWITLIPFPVILLVTACVFLYLSSVAGFLVFLLLAFVAEFANYLTYNTSEFAVTDRRVLVKVGWIARRSLEVLLSKSESIRVDQGIAGRIFDYGTIVVAGTGGTPGSFAQIAAPFEFYNRVQTQIAALREETPKQ